MAEVGGRLGTRLKARGGRGGRAAEATGDGKLLSAAEFIGPRPCSRQRKSGADPNAMHEECMLNSLLKGRSCLEFAMRFGMPSFDIATMSPAWRRMADGRGGTSTGCNPPVPPVSSFLPVVGVHVLQRQVPRQEDPRVLAYFPDERVDHRTPFRLGVKGDEISARIALPDDFQG